MSKKQTSKPNPDSFYSAGTRDKSYLSIGMEETHVLFYLKAILEAKSPKVYDRWYLKSEENKNGNKDNSEVPICSTDKIVGPFTKT